MEGVSTSRAKFILNFDQGLAQLISSEFQSFYDAFQKTVPWYKTNLIIVVLAIVAAAAMIVVFLNAGRAQEIGNTPKLPHTERT
jgi:hypothetical protein